MAYVFEQKDLDPPDEIDFDCPNCGGEMEEMWDDDGMYLKCADCQTWMPEGEEDDEVMR